MLETDPAKRLSAEQCLQHEYFKENMDGIVTITLQDEEEFN
jgi:hypothetical protein